MASVVMLRHKDNGIIKKGFYGFSWTTFFFGFLPALFREDFIIFIGGQAISLILGFMTCGIGWLLAGFVWAFFYNKYYTRKLLERGYVFADAEGRTAEARMRLGVAA